MTTRLLKAQCGFCAYTVRVTMKWLAELGPPLCPCNRQPMECEAWDDAQRAAAEATAAEHRILRDRWVTLRSHQRCAQCRGECSHGEPMRHVVAVTDGALVSAYTCSMCDSGEAGANQRRVLARA